MPWEMFGEYSFAGLVAGVLLYIFARITKSLISGLKENSNNYMKIIEDQTVTKNNHIAHLDESVKETNKVVATQGEKFVSGVDKICDALKSQTKVIEIWMDKK